MTDFEGFYVSVAQAAIDFNTLMVSRLESNREQFGMQDKVLANKIDSVMDNMGAMVNPFLGESVRLIEEGGSLAGLGDCMRGTVGFAIGTIQSYVPTFIHMNARLCESDFGCNYEKLIRSGMRVSEVADELYMRLMGQRSFLPPFPVPNFIFVENPIDVYYQTDTLFFLDSARMIPEYKVYCGFTGGSDATSDLIVATLAGTMEIISPMIVEYGNIANMLSRRPFYPPNHDWAVTVLSLLETDKEFYGEPIFFAFPEGNVTFAKCMIAQSKKSRPFLRRLRKIIREEVGGGLTF